MIQTFEDERKRQEAARREKEAKLRKSTGKYNNYFIDFDIINSYHLMFICFECRFFYILKQILHYKSYKFNVLKWDCVIPPTFIKGVSIGISLALRIFMDFLTRD